MVSTGEPSPVAVASSRAWESTERAQATSRSHAARDFKLGYWSAWLASISIAGGGFIGVVPGPAALGAVGAGAATLAVTRAGFRRAQGRKQSDYRAAIRDARALELAVESAGPNLDRSELSGVASTWLGIAEVVAELQVDPKEIGPGSAPGRISANAVRRGWEAALDSGSDDTLHISFNRILGIAPSVPLTELVDALGTTVDRYRDHGDHDDVEQTIALVETVVDRSSGDTDAFAARVAGWRIERPGKRAGPAPISDAMLSTQDLFDRIDGLGPSDPRPPQPGGGIGNR